MSDLTISLVEQKVEIIKYLSFKIIFFSVYLPVECPSSYIFKSTNKIFRNLQKKNLIQLNITELKNLLLRKKKEIPKTKSENSHLFFYRQVRKFFSIVKHMEYDYYQFLMIYVDF